MCQTSLVELYKAVKSKPTPCELFIKEVAEVANRAESTVNKWVIGLAVPDVNVRMKLSEHFNIPVDVLFPNVKKRHAKQWAKGRFVKQVHYHWD